MHYNSEKPIGVIYRHAEHFNPLFTELKKSGLSYEIIDPSNQYFNPLQRELPFSLVLNDMSNPSYQKNKSGILIEYLKLIEGLHTGASIINGSRIGETFTYQTRQFNIFASLDMPFPKTIVASNTEQFLKSIHELKFPILVSYNDCSEKTRFESEAELVQAIILDQLNFDNRALVIQEYIPSKGNHTVRAEMLNGRFLYAVKIFCAGDSSEGWSLEAHMEVFTPPLNIITALEKIAHASLMDVGSISFITDRRSNTILFQGIQPHTSTYSQEVKGLTVNMNEHIANYVGHRLRKIREIELSI
ncbi:MAG TPA: hypothetical protein VGK59_15945 [Ohtaekwangia sp.]